MTRFEGEEEGTSGGDLLQPLGQITGHYDEWILQLAIGLGGDLKNWYIDVKY